MKSKILPILMMLGFSSFTQADVVFGIDSAGQLHESESMEQLFAGNSIVHAASPVGWNRNLSVFIADGKIYGVDSGSRLIEYTSVSNLWNGVDPIIHGKSSVGWHYSNEYFAHDGQYYGMSTSGTLVKANSALNLWNGVYEENFGDTPNGWNASNPFLMTSEGVYSISVSASLYKWSAGDSVQYGTSSAAFVSAASPVGWNVGHAYFGGDSLDGISLTASGNLKTNNVSTPLSFGFISLIGMAFFQRKLKKKVQESRSYLNKKPALAQADAHSWICILAN